MFHYFNFFLIMLLILIFKFSPPDPLRRYLAFRFCEILQRECEFISLSRDTVESDLKQVSFPSTNFLQYLFMFLILYQRREMINRSAKYIGIHFVQELLQIIM